jgi:putative hydrolase of the HAD superfamily
MPHPRFRALYSDIGGVLGTNGWDTKLRKRICDHFGVEGEDVEARHHLMFDSFERGYMSFESYLEYVFFHVPRPFTLEELRTYTYNASTAWPENIEFFARVKRDNQLKLALISNEGRGITEHRVGKFGLRELADFMVISHYIHFRKPDLEIWRLALNLAQVTAEESIYIDDREIFVEVAREIGFTAIHHTSLENTRAELRRTGLTVK